MKTVKYNPTHPDLYFQDENGQEQQLPFCRNGDDSMIIFESQQEHDDWLEAQKVPDGTPE